MGIEERIFAKKAVVTEQLLAYGFQRVGDEQYSFKTNFFKNQFTAILEVDNHGKVTGKVIDRNTGEEYLPLRALHQGPYAKLVAGEYQKLLQDIANKCFVDQPFIMPQANQIACWVAQHFAEHPDHPFKRSPDIAVFREASSSKWYGLVMNIPQNKLRGTPQRQASEKVEVLEVKINPADRQNLLKLPGIYHGYHLDRPNWVCMPLDDSLTDHQVIKMLCKSRSLLLKNNVWLIPANPKYYDIMGAFDHHQEIIWKQSTNIHVGDIVFIYVTAPIKAVIYQCQVEEVDIPYQYHQDQLTITKVMKIRLLQRYPRGQFDFAFLRKQGIKAIRRPRHLPANLVTALQQN